MSCFEIITRSKKGTNGNKSRGGDAFFEDDDDFFGGMGGMGGFGNFGGFGRMGGFGFGGGFDQMFEEMRRGGNSFGGTSKSISTSTIIKYFFYVSINFQEWKESYCN